MPVTIRRYGGIMAMKPRENSFSLEELDPQAKAAIDALVKEPPAAVKRAADGFVYSVEVNTVGKNPVKFELTGPDVPEALRKLLP